MEALFSIFLDPMDYWSRRPSRAPGQIPTRLYQTRAQRQFNFTYNQRVIVRGSYTQAAKISSHLKYILRKDALDEYDTNNKTPAPNRPLAGEKRFYKIIVSPENAHKLNMSQYAKIIAGVLRKNIGADIIYHYAIHKDTDNPHIHFVIRGVDTRGKEIRIPKEAIKTTIREHACEHTTAILGKRTKAEIERNRAETINRPGITFTDRLVQKILNDTAANTLRPTDFIMANRLNYLSRLGLATNSLGVYTLQENYLTVLKQMQEQIDYQKVISSQEGNTGRKILPTGKDATVKGIVHSINYYDDLQEKGILIIKTNTNSLYAVKLDETNFHKHLLATLKVGTPVHYHKGYIKEEKTLER